MSREFDKKWALDLIDELQAELNLLREGIKTGQVGKRLVKDISPTCHRVAYEQCAWYRRTSDPGHLLSIREVHKRLLELERNDHLPKRKGWKIVPKSTTFEHYVYQRGRYLKHHQHPEQ